MTMPLSHYQNELSYLNHQKRIKDYLEVKLYSALELLVIKDMHENGLDYPFISVDAVKEYWRERLS
jgi:hypothetical protein